jgi:hypothetical protein
LRQGQGGCQGDGTGGEEFQGMFHVLFSVRMR